MTLIERSAPLENRINRKAVRDEKAQLASTIADWQKVVDLCAKRVRGNAERASALRDAALPPSPFSAPAVVRECGEAAERLRGLSTSNSASEVFESRAWKGFSARIEEAAKAHESTVKEALKAARETVIAISLEGLEALAGMCGSRDEWSALVALKQKVGQAKWLVVDPAEVRQLLALRADLMRRAGALTQIGAPEEVRVFLEKARRGTAVIDDLTAEVRTWLKEKNLLGNLRITLGGL